MLGVLDLHKVYLVDEYGNRFGNVYEMDVSSKCSNASGKTDYYDITLKILITLEDWNSRFIIPGDTGAREVAKTVLTRRQISLPEGK